MAESTQGGGGVLHLKTLRSHSFIKGSQGMNPETGTETEAIEDYCLSASS